MGRNEIRLRRHRITAHGAERFRNYNSVLKRHEENRRIKKIVRVFGFFVVILVVIMIIAFLSRWEERSQPKGKGQPKATHGSLTYPPPPSQASLLWLHRQTPPRATRQL